MSFLFSFALDSDAVSYQRGRGLKVKPLRATFGGYVTVTYEKEKRNEKLSLDDIAFLIYGKPISRVRYFLELELNGAYSVVNGRKRTRKKIDIERAYIDFELNESLKLRLGRFITPIGLWNPVHINVLKWTTSDPLTATEFFPRFTTGVELFGEFRYGLSYSLFFQNNRGISEEYNTFPTRKVLGGEIRKELADSLKFGLNAGQFDIRSPKETLTFFGANAIYKVPKLEISGEFMYAIEEENSDVWSHRLSYYLQGVYRVFKGNYTILRYGYFEDKSDRETYRVWTIGWNFRPVYYVALKAEYQFRERKELNAFLTSFSWMF